MTEAQYRRLWLNRQRVGARGLATPHPRSEHSVSILGRIIQQAAERLRQRAAAAAAWARVAPPALVKETWVLGVDGPILRVGVRSAAVAYELRRQREKLVAALVRSMSGVRDVRFDVSRPPVAETD